MMKKEMLERALGLNEKQLGEEQYQMVIVLMFPTNAFGNLGHPKTKKEMLGGALSIDQHLF